MTMRGQTQTFLVTFYDAPGGAVADVTGLTLTLLLAGSPVYGPFTTPAVAHDGPGRYRYEWTVPGDAAYGTYTAVWSGVLPDETNPSVGYETVTVTEAPTVPEAELPDFCWPVDTSCVTDWDAWKVEPDPEADPPVVGVPLYTEAAKARAVSLAAQSLRMLTAYRVGGCPVTVRPAARRCRDLTWRTYPVAGGSGSTPWQPVDLGGQWLNIGCGHDATCGCLGIREVRLGAASSVAEVKVDGLVLDPTAYRLDPGGRLVRLDGEGWPLCQNLAAPDTVEGTWAVTYTAGAPVDGHGAYAAGVLAGEFVRACSGRECRLPDNVVTLTRQGVTMTFGQGAFPEMRTGLREVDAYLERWNPNRHKSAPLVWSPDLHRPRRTT